MGFKYLDYNFVKLLWKRSWIREAHENGIRVNTWTVDNRVIMRKLMGEGVDYLTTNEPIEAMALAESTIAHREIMPDEPDGSTLNQ